MFLSKLFGKIYKICIGSILLYIGSTCKTIEQRLVGHEHDLLQAERPLYAFMREANLSFEDLNTDILEFLITIESQCEA